MCEFIITALHIHNCVFNEKMKKKIILTHTPLFLYYRTSIVTTQCTSTNEIHEIRFIKNHLLFHSNITLNFLKLRATLGTESLFSLVKAELLQEGIFFLIHLFARDILVMKNLEIEKTKPTYMLSVLKVEYQVVLVSQISNFFINKMSLANKWMRKRICMYLLSVVQLQKIVCFFQKIFLLIKKLEI